MRKAAIAKIASPRLFSVIPRRRLFRLLDERLRHPVLWVEGPPGAGKTALVASYVESRRLRAVWYQIDPGDSDVSTFFYFLGLAAPKGKSPLPVFAPDYLTDPEGFARRFFRDFYARLGERGVLVLDNYQEIPAAAPIHRLIAAALAEIPEDTHVIAISRSPPPPEVCRLQAIEALCTIDWQELRLTLDEARAVATARGMNEESTLKALYERSDGWMAGFVLLVERFRRGGMQPGDARFETQEAVFSYFAGQIFNTVPQSSQEILLQTAFLPWVTTELAERMTGDQEAWRVLDTLYRQHLFTDRRTQLRSFRGAAPTPPSAVGQETEHVFQFHALFRTFLLDTAATVYSAERYRSLVRRAGSLLDERGMSEEALRSYLDAQAWDEAVRLIEQDATRLLSQGRWQTLRNWIEALPVTSLQNSPWLFYWMGRALIPTSHTEARKNLEIAITLFHDRGDVIGELLSASAVVWSLFLEARATEQFKSWIPVLDGMLAQRPEFPSAAIEMTIVSASMLVTMWNQPDRPNLHGNMLRLLQLMDSDASANEKIAVAGFALQYCRNTANFDLGDQFVAKIDPLIGAPEVMPLERVIWLVVRGCHFYVTAQDERALQELRAARALAHQEGLALVEKHALEFLSYLCVFMGHRADAEKALAAQEQLLRPDKPVNLANYYLGRVFFAQLSGLSADALQFADRARDAASKTNAPFFMLAWDAALAGVYAEAGQLDKAASLIARARQLSSGTCYACYESLILMDEAYLAHLQGDEVARNDFLTKALSCAKSQRTASYFRWMIVGMPILFAEALRLNIEPDYVKSLIRAWKVRSPSQHIRYWPWAVQIDALGGFSILKDSVPLKFGRKAPIRLVELLKLIVAKGGREVRNDYLMQELWPQAEGDAAEVAFTNALHRLRKLLGHEDVIVLRQGRVSINDAICQIDLWVFESLCSEVQAMADGPIISPDSIFTATSELLELYRGHLLGDESFSWVAERREKARRGFARTVTTLGAGLEGLGKLEAASALYRRAIEVDCLAEPFYLRLMVCLKALNQGGQAADTYRRLRDMLSIVLGLKPSQESTEAFESLRAQE